MLEVDLACYDGPMTTKTAVDAKTRFACSECGSTFPTLVKAGKCHWGIAGIVDRNTDPDLWAKYVDVLS